MEVVSPLLSSSQAWLSIVCLRCGCAPLLGVKLFPPPVTLVLDPLRVHCSLSKIRLLVFRYSLAPPSLLPVGLPCWLFLLWFFFFFFFFSVRCQTNRCTPPPFPCFPRLLFGPDSARLSGYSWNNFFITSPLLEIMALDHPPLVGRVFVSWPERLLPSSFHVSYLFPPSFFFFL